MQQKSKLSLAPKGGGTSSSGRVPTSAPLWPGSRQSWVIRDVRVSSSFDVRGDAMHVHGHAWRAQEYITELLREPVLPPDTSTVPPHSCRERLIEWRSTPIADLADTLRASEFVGFLPTWRLTQTLEDEHTDCTHYCLDSGVHDAVLDAVAFELSVRVRS